MQQAPHHISPHLPLLIVGVVLMAIHGSGRVISWWPLRLEPHCDIVLNPQSIPSTQHVVYLNSLVTSRIHHVWSVFALALLFLFLIKGVAEYFGSTLIQYTGLASITDLRNQTYSRVDSATHQDFFRAAEPAASCPR